MRSNHLGLVAATPTLADLNYRWYGVCTKKNFEKATAGSLAYKGFECYVPCFRHRRRWADRVTEIESPLFSGYVFCRFDVSKRLPILTTPGVVSVVGIGKQPLSIPDHELAAIRTILESAQHAGPWPYLREGQKVRLERGPLSGVEGIILKKKKGDKWRLVVSVTLLQRSVAAEVERDWVQVVP